MFQRWADAVAAIPIDDGAPKSAGDGAAAQTTAGQAATQAATQATGPSPLRIDLVDHMNSPSSRDLGLRAAVALVDSELAGLRQKISADAPADAPGEARAAPHGAPEAPVQARGAVRAAGAFMAQLGAFQSRDAAEQAWSKMKTQHASVLARLAARYKTVDMGGRGVWTRVQAGPFPTQSEASAVCAGLGVSDRWCIVPRRD